MPTPPRRPRRPRPTSARPEPQTVADPPALFDIGALSDTTGEPTTLGRRDPAALDEQGQADEPEDLDGVEIMHTRRHRNPAAGHHQG